MNNLHNLDRVLSAMSPYTTGKDALLAVAGGDDSTGALLLARRALADRTDNLEGRQHRRRFDLGRCGAAAEVRLAYDSVNGVLARRGAI